jgi:CDP-glucose 4,6-dehydratase
LSGYLSLAGRLADDPDSARWAGSWNFGPLPDDEATVADLATSVIDAWGEGRWVRAGGAGRSVEAATLRIAIDKAVTILGWRPTWHFAEAVVRTVDWYREYHEGPASMRDRCLADIRAYEQSMA